MSSAHRALSGYMIKRASMLRCSPVPARRGSGHSHARPMMPRMRFMIWRMGKGLTAESRFLVRKSQKILGQKKASRAAAIWSVVLLVHVQMVGCVVFGHLQAAAVRMTNLAQWFLINLPMVM